MSQSAVQRLLEKEGTSFRQLSEEVRRSAAERYLLGTDLPMKEIAYLLGFSELSTFSRAVKTWFGVSPKKVRDAPRSRSSAAANSTTGRKQPMQRSRSRWRRPPLFGNPLPQNDFVSSPGQGLVTAKL